MYEEICYKKTFLKQVIARIDFVTTATPLETALPNKLGKIISQHFKIAEPQDIVSSSVLFGVGIPPKQTEEKHKQWNFYSKDRSDQLSVAQNYIFVLYKNYTKFEDMKTTFGTIVNSLDQEVPEITASRFGLRYINNIEIEGLKKFISWNKYIHSNLAKATSFFSGEREKHLSRLFHVAELKYEDINVKFQFGMPNPDYPALIKRPLFVLDFDASVEMSHNLNESLQYMNIAHRHIQTLFEESITDKLRGRMNAGTNEPI